jgi:hypothetical protein
MTMAAPKRKAKKAKGKKAKAKKAPPGIVGHAIAPPDAVNIDVEIDAKGIHVEPVTLVPFGASEVRLIWTIKTKGWRFAANGIEIEQGDGLARLLLRRNLQLIDVLKAKKRGAVERLRAEMARDYERFILGGPGGDQFHSPSNQGQGKVFQWFDRNEYPDIYKYSITVTNGSTTMFLDPAIKNQGC